MEKPDSTSFDASPILKPQIDWREQQPCAGDLLRSAAYAAIQAPAVAVGQIVDKVTGSKVADNLTLIDAPKAADFGTVKWHAQQIGAAVGGLVPFLGALALTKNVSSATRAEEFAFAYSKASAATTASVFRTGEMATAGFVQGALFEPNAHKDNIVGERLTQGITSGVTMGSLHLLSNNFASLTGASAYNASILNKSLTTGAAGGVAGLIGVRTNEFLSEQKLSGEEVGKSIYQAAFTGVALGGLAGAQLRLHQGSDKPIALTEYVAKDKNFEISQSSYLDFIQRTNRWRENSAPLDGASNLNEVTKLPRYSPVEKAELVGMLGRDADPLLSKPEVIDAFLKKMDGTWSDDLTHKNAMYNAAIERATRLQQSLELQMNDGTESRQDGRDYAAIKRLLKKQDAKLDDLLDARNEALYEHGQRIGIAVNEFLTDHNLPTVDFSVLPSMEAEGSYAYGGVRLNGWQLGEKLSEPHLLNHLYHELAHLRQDTLIIRLFADELGLPKNPTPEQVQQLKVAFTEHALRASGATPSADETMQHVFEKEVTGRRGQETKAQIDELVDKVVAIRSSYEPTLSREDRALAQHMRQGALDYQKRIKVEGLDETDERRFNLTNDFIDNNSLDVTAKALNDVVSNPIKFQERYGFASIPAELEAIAREHSQNPEHLTEAELLEPRKLKPTLEQFDYYDSLLAKLKPMLTRQSDLLDSKYYALMDQKAKLYLATNLERQAFPTGYLAELTYRANQAAQRGN